MKSSALTSSIDQRMARSNAVQGVQHEYAVTAHNLLDNLDQSVGNEEWLDPSNSFAAGDLIDRSRLVRSTLEATAGRTKTLFSETKDYAEKTLQGDISGMVRPYNVERIGAALSLKGVGLKPQLRRIATDLESWNIAVENDEIGAFSSRKAERVAAIGLAAMKLADYDSNPDKRNDAFLSTLPAAVEELTPIARSRDLLQDVHILGTLQGLVIEERPVSEDQLEEILDGASSSEAQIALTGIYHQLVKDGGEIRRRGVPNGSPFNRFSPDVLSRLEEVPLEELDRLVDALRNGKPLKIKMPKISYLRQKKRQLTENIHRLNSENKSLQEGHQETDSELYKLNSELQAVTAAIQAIRSSEKQAA